MGDVKDAHGGFFRDTFETSKFQLATYTWIPDCGIENARGCVFIMHGILAHVRFEFLDPNQDNMRVELKGSLIERLLKLDMIVFGHDHPAHGLSSGIRAYWDSFDDLRDAAIEYFDHIRTSKEYGVLDKPRFLAGMSMGGTVSVEVARKRPDLFTGYILFSPAVKTPDDMFGLYGRFLASLSGLLSWATPQLPVLGLPPSPLEEIRDAVEKDVLVIKQPVRCRPGAEFLRIYSDIESNVDSISFPALLVFVGATDPIVSPNGIESFIASVKCKDKTVHVCTDSGHEVLREANRQEVRAKVCEWIAEHM